VQIVVDGMAASTASWVALAGDELVMAANAYLMIHDPYACCYGAADDLRDTADLLDKLAGTIADLYAAKSGGDAKDFLAQMNDETWFTAAEALEAGLADSVGNADADASGADDDALLAAGNRFDLSAFAKVPAPLKNKQPAGAETAPASIETIRDFEGLLRDAGFSNRRAKAIAVNGFKAKSEPRDEDGGAVALMRSHVANTKRIFTCPPER
jgi:ClpP class serine protease